MHKERLQYLFDKRFRGKLSEQEADEFKTFVMNASNQNLLEEVINEYLHNPPDVSLPDETHISAMIERIIHEERTAKSSEIQHATIYLRKHRYSKKWIWAAASLLLIISAGLLLRYKYSESDKPDAKNEIIQPGHNGAILTLSDGSTLVLDSAANGQIATQGGSKVMLNNRGLSYDASEVKNASLVFNTVSTPKGRQFALVLPDGTHAWINSESSIKYPAAFHGKERQVSVTGEVYFEVAKNRAMPFKVNVNNKAEIEVTGTHFDVNAYDNESSLKASLFEGSVKVWPLNNQQQIIKLSPGQQSELTKGTIHVNKNIDESKILAWKNGLFDFDDVPLEEAMRQLSRWYDIDVVYKNNHIPDIKFYGQINKDITLNELLTALQLTNVKFTIQEHKLIISP